MRTVFARLAFRLFGAMLAIAIPVVSYAATSTNYRLDESTFGSGGLPTSGSASYQADGSVVSGTTASSGNGTASSSANNQVNGGGSTTSDPALIFQIGSSTVSFGQLSTSVASTGTSTFSVKNYTSSGYIVQVYGSPPTSGSHALAGLNPKAPSQVGAEQFGINVVANTSPVSFGADPVQVPSGSFSYGIGEVGDLNTTGYTKPNYYRYVSGETIAKSLKSSGQTDYTISYLANAAVSTPGGSYTTNLQLICTGTY